MGKKHPLLTSGLTLLILFIACSVSATRFKGNVVMLAADHEQACSAVVLLAGADAASPCLLEQEITTMAVVELDKKAGISEGQDIILKARGCHKVMAKAYRVLTPGVTAAEISRGIEKNGVIALKDADGRIILVLPEKPFKPEKDSAVTVKTKQKQVVEGC